MKFPIKKSRSFFRKIGSCASYASYTSCASYSDCASESRRMFGIKTIGMNSFHRLRLLLPPPTGRWKESAGGGRSPQAVEGVRSGGRRSPRSPENSAFALHMLHMLLMPRMPKSPDVFFKNHQVSFRRMSKSSACFFHRINVF